MVAGSVERDGRSGHRLLLAAILLVAFFLRFATLGSQGLWTDEALTIVLSNWSVGDMILKPTDPTPFLYYALHKLFIPANAPVEVVRSISLVMGMLSVGLMYVVGRLAFGRAGGLIAAALLAVWHSHVEYSQEARAYSLLFLLTLLTSCGLLYYARCLDRAVETGTSQANGRRLALALFAVANVLSFYTHVVAVFWIVVTSLILLFIAVRGRRGGIPEVLIVFGVMAVCAVPGIYRLLHQILIGDDFKWLEQSKLFFAIYTATTVFLPVGLWDNALMGALGLKNYAHLAVAVSAVALLGAGLWTHRLWVRGMVRERPVVLLLILAYMIVPVLMWLFGFIARPIYMYRVILYCVPGMILLITAVCLSLGRRKAAIAAIVAVLLFGMSTLVSGATREKEDWRGAYRFLAASAAPGDVIATCPLYNYPSLRYPAQAPVGAAVIAVTGDGSLIEIEHGLGTNPDWDKTYFRNVFVPNGSGRFAAPDHANSPLRLQAGQTLWRVDGHCNPDFSADMDRMLSSLAVEPELAWIEKGRLPARYRIVVWRYRVVAPTVLEVKDVAPRGQKTDLLRGVARLP